jgi:preprotein translocase subunit YajC
VQFLPILLIIVVFWFFVIRPQMKRQRDAQQMQAQLEVDSRVMLTSGIFGTVREITPDHVLVEIADNVAIEVVRAAIGRVMPTELDEPATTEVTPDERPDEPEENQ